MFRSSFVACFHAPKGLSRPENPCPAGLEPLCEVRQRDRSFTVLPHAARDDREMGLDMLKAFDDNWLDIPDGWKVYEVCKAPLGGLSFVTLKGL